MVLQGWVTPQEAEGFVSQMGLQVSWLEGRVTDKLGAERWPCAGKGHQLCPIQRLAATVISVQDDWVCTAP